MAESAVDLHKRRRFLMIDRSKSPRVWFTSRLVLGAVLLLLMVSATFVVPAVTGQGVDDQIHESFLGPSFHHPFGTDEVGRDIFTRAFYGLRFDLALIFVAVPISLVIGTFIGMLRALNPVAGELGQRLVEIQLGFPHIILGISIAAILGPGATSLLLTVILAGIPPYGRLARNAVLVLEKRDYVQAARAFGMTRFSVTVRHIVPNAASLILTQFPISLVNAIILEASLSVIGLGLQPPSPSLGGVISAGRANIYSQYWYVLGPTILFVVLAVALTLVAEGVKKRALQ